MWGKERQTRAAPLGQRPVLLLAVLFGLLGSAAALRPEDAPPSLRVSAIHLVADMHRIVVQELAKSDGAPLPFDFVSFNSGKASLEALLSGELDLVAAAGVPVVDRFLTERSDNVPERDRLVILASHVVTRDVMTLVVDEATPITDLSDLAGARVGVMTGTLMEFVLDREFQAAGMDMAEVELMHVPLAESEQALLSGHVDAVALPDPFPQVILDNGQGRFSAWNGFPIHQSSVVLVTTQGVLEAKGDQIRDYMDLLLDAETLQVTDHAQVVSMLSEALGISVDMTEQAMARFTFRTALGETTVTSLQDILAWRCQDRTQPGCTATLRSIMRPEILKSLDPQRVWLLGD